MLFIKILCINHEQINLNCILTICFKRVEEIFKHLSYNIKWLLILIKKELLSNYINNKH